MAELPYDGNGSGEGPATKLEQLRRLQRALNSFASTLGGGQDKEESNTGSHDAAGEVDDPPSERPSKRRRLAAVCDTGVQTEGPGEADHSHDSSSSSSSSSSGALPLQSLSAFLHSHSEAGLAPPALDDKDSLAGDVLDASLELLFEHPSFVESEWWRGGGR